MLVAKMFQGISEEQLRFMDFGFAPPPPKVKYDFESHRCRA
jgi:hypothetical protein